MAKVELLDADQAPLLARPNYRGGDPGPLVAALAQVPELLEVAIPFLNMVLGPSSIPARTKELVILRTSARLGCRFCVQTHTVVALDAGLSTDEVRALRDEAPIDPAFASPAERDLLAWVDGVAGPGDAGRTDPPAALADHEVVELTMLVGATMMLNRFCTALALPTSVGHLKRLAAEGLV
jgi:AhpD family alkylhydroperoxidase